MKCWYIANEPFLIHNTGCVWRGHQDDWHHIQATWLSFSFFFSPTLSRLNLRLYAEFLTQPMNTDFYQYPVRLMRPRNSSVMWRIRGHLLNRGSFDGRDGHNTCAESQTWGLTRSWGWTSCRAPTQALICAATDATSVDSSRLTSVQRARRGLMLNPTQQWICCLNFISVLLFVSIANKGVMNQGFCNHQGNLLYSWWFYCFQCLRLRVWNEWVAAYLWHFVLRYDKKRQVWRLFGSLFENICPINLQDEWL